MVSAQIKGIIRFYKKTPAGNRVLLFESDIQAVGNGGSSDGAIANTYEKWAMIPPQAAPERVMQPNDHLLVTYECATAATADASDGVVSLPLTLSGGAQLTLGKFDSTSSWDVKQLGDVALPAAETVIAERTVRETCVLGSNVSKCFISVENNA